MKTVNVSFRHAVEILQAHLPSLVANKTSIKNTTVNQLPATLENEQDDKTVLMQIVDYYNQCLKETPDALLTFDNGTEFARYEKIAKKLSAKTFFVIHTLHESVVLMKIPTG